MGDLPMVYAPLHPCGLDDAEAYENLVCEDGEFGSGGSLDAHRGHKSGELRRDETQHCVPQQRAIMAVAAAVRKMRNSRNSTGSAAAKWSSGHYIETVGFDICAAGGRRD